MVPLIVVLLFLAALLRSPLFKRVAPVGALHRAPLRLRRLLAAAPAATVLLVGCEPQRPSRDRDPNALVIPAQADDEEGYLLVIALDLSGSYQPLMTKDGKAFEFVTNATDEFFRNRLGSGDQVIVAQLSAAGTKALLWHGSPEDLRSDFDSAEDFRRMLLQKSNASSSRLFDGIADCIEYTLEQPGVRDRKRRVVFLALTDTDDNQSAGSARMRNALKQLAQVKSVVGFYWVDSRLVGKTRATLTEAGFRTFVVESEIKSRCPLPHFEE